MPDPKPLIVAVIVGSFLVYLLYRLIRRLESQQPKPCKLPASPCRECDEVERVWGDPWADEPSHRACRCSQVSVRWDEWEERNAVN